MKNKFRLLPGVYIIIVLLLMSTAFAHRGNTDGSGGHHNHITGEYHYHHGYSAHQHTGGVCPYDFDDKTGWSSGSSSGAVSSSSKDNQISDSQWGPSGQAAKEQEQLTAKDDPSESKKKRTFWDVVLYVFLLLVLAWPALIYAAALFFFILSAVFELPGLRRLKSKWESRQKEKQELKRQRDELLRLEQWNAEKQKVVDFFNGESAQQKACVPNGVMFSGDHWPISLNGCSILVCPNREMTRYHKPTCRHARGITPVSAYQINPKCIPCEICKPIRFAGAPDWLEKYNIYIQIKEAYEIEDPDIAVSDKTSQHKNLNMGTSAKEIAQFDYLVDLSKMCELSLEEFVAHIDCFCRKNCEGNVCAEEDISIKNSGMLKKEYQRALILIDLKRISKTVGYDPVEFLTAAHLSLLKQSGVSQTKAQAIIREKCKNYKLL